MSPSALRSDRCGASPASSCAASQAAACRAWWLVGSARASRASLRALRRRDRGHGGRDRRMGRADGRPAQARLVLERRTSSPSLADALLDAFETGTPLASFSAAYPGFDVAAAYDVLREAERARVARGWQPVGRKIGFTNRTIWPRYGVYRPMWAHVWRETVTDAPDGSAAISLAPAAEPRIEPEVVFGLRGAGAAGRRRARGARCRRVDRARLRDRAVALSRTGSSPPPTAPPRSACTAPWWSVRAPRSTDAARDALRGGAAVVRAHAAPRRRRDRPRGRRQRPRQSRARARASRARARRRSRRCRRSRPASW